MDFHCGSNDFNNEPNARSATFLPLMVGILFGLVVLIIN